MPAPLNQQGPVTKRPPTPSLPLKGGGGKSAAICTSLRHAKQSPSPTFSCQKGGSSGATASPPPLRGRVREGGVFPARRPNKLSPWPTNAPAGCAAIQPMPKGSSGRCSGASSSPVIGSAGRCRSAPMSSTSPALQRTWSSRSTAGSMLFPSKETKSAQPGLKRAATRSCVSGTTRCLGTRMACSRASCVPSARKRPPTPSLPLQGGGGKSAPKQASSLLISHSAGDRLA